MNEKQKIVLVIVAVVVLAMLLYPPFHIVRDIGVGGWGYSWIFNPPHFRATVNTGLLLTQWIGVLIVGIIAYLFFKDNK